MGLVWRIHCSRGVQTDLELAAHDSKLAVDHGHVEASFHFGVCLGNGDGVANDFKMMVLEFGIPGATLPGQFRFFVSQMLGELEWIWN
jgi:hypothetical protein